MVSASEYAVLASAAYARNDDTLALRKIEEESDGRFKSSDYEVLEGDADYKVFKKLSTGEVIVACRGTSGLDDANPDLFIAAGVLPFHERSKKIVAVTRKYRNLYDNVTITGHSLGGALASSVAVRTDTMAVTFNQGSSPMDKPIQGLGKILGYRYKNIIHFAVCNDVVSTSACLVDNVTNIRIPTASSSALSALRNHRLGQFLVLPDTKYEELLSSTSTRIREHQQANPDQINGPSNPITKVVGSFGASYASYKAFLASIDKAIDQLRLYNDPTLQSQLDHLQNAVDNVRDIEDNARTHGQNIARNTQRAVFESLDSRLRDVTSRVSNLFQRSTPENIDDVMIELDGVFDATYDQHARAFFDDMSSVDVEDLPVGVDMEREVGDIVRDDIPEMEAGLDISEVGDFLSGVGDMTSITSNAGPLFAGVTAIVGIALGIYHQQQLANMRTSVREQTSKNRRQYAHEFHSLLNNLSTFVKRPTPSSTTPTRTTRVDLPKIGSVNIELPVDTSSRDIIIPKDTGRWQDSELDYYGPEALKYLRWRVANPDIDGPTKEVVEGIGAAYRILISPGPFWPPPAESTGMDDYLYKEEYNRKRAYGQSLHPGRGGVATYVDSYQWLLQDNAKRNASEYKRRIEALLSKHVRHKFSELSEDAKSRFIESFEKFFLYANMDSNDQIRLAKSISSVKGIVDSVMKLTSLSPNAQSFISAATSFRDAVAKKMTVDLTIESTRRETRRFIEENLPIFIQGVTILSRDPLMFNVYSMNGGDMNTYQVYVSAGVVYKRGQWSRSLLGSADQQREMQSRLKDESYSLDAYIKSGHSYMGDGETEQEFVDRYFAWVEFTASQWTTKTHRAVVEPHIHPVTPVDKDTTPSVTIPDVPSIPVDQPVDDPQICVRKRRRRF